MDLKRICCNNFSIQASLTNLETGEIIPIKNDEDCVFGRSLDSTIIIDKKFISLHHCVIKYENNRFIISDLDSSAGTFLNCVKLSTNTNKVEELHQGDAIGFGQEKKLIVSYRFVLQTIPNKKLKSDNEHNVQEALKEVKKCKNTVSEYKAEILSMKNEVNELRKEFKTEFDDILTLVKNLMDIVSENTLKEENKMENMTEEIAMLKSANDSMEQNLTERIKHQFYDLLKNEFQCSICLDLLSRATTINCNHTFCSVCISTWKGSGNSNCPLCETLIESDIKCNVLDDYITKICNLMGDEIKEQRRRMLTEKSVSVTVSYSAEDHTGNNSDNRPSVRWELINFDAAGIFSRRS